jgi:hypothetical protein
MKGIADAIRKATRAATKEWARQRKAEERGTRSRRAREYIYSDRVCFTDVCDEILPGGYEHASGAGRYTVGKRHLFYCVRDEFRERTGKELDYSYFSKSLLVQYMNRHPDETAGWKLTADPRGFLHIPNAAHEVTIPIGTSDIDDYLRNKTGSARPFDDVERAGLIVHWPSLARVGERFDLAVASCKGQSVVACRKLVDTVCAMGRGVPLLVVHDFDKSGFEISLRLTEVSDWAREKDLVKYEFQHQIDVRDLGLRLEDVLEMGLEDRAEDVDFTGGFAPDSIATEEEKEFLRSGRRVELDAMTAEEFLEWLEGKIQEQLPGRLIPKDAVLADAYRRALAVARINRVLEKVTEKAIEHAGSAEVPRSLRRRLKKAMKDAPSEAWDEALYRLAKKARREP